MSPSGGQRGFGVIAAIVVLVILALLAASIVSLGSTQQLTAAQDVQSARAWLAARAGDEWGLYQAIKLGKCDEISGTTLDLPGDTGFHVRVNCAKSGPYAEGLVDDGSGNLSVPKTYVYRIEAVACPVASVCPANDASVASPGYVERRRVVLATHDK